MNKICLGLLCLFFFAKSIAQEDELRPIWFVEPEIMIGKLVPHVPDFPRSPLNSGIHLSIGKWNYASTEGWGAFYNRPQYGFDFGCHWFGNNKILGQQFTVMPFLTIPTSKTWYKGVQFKIAGGANIYTNWYDTVDNPENELVGSPITWAFQLSVQKTWAVSDRIDIKSGISLIHASNAHTTIPNYGMNSIAASFSVQYFKKSKEDFVPNREKNKYLDKHYYLTLSQGVGYHELGGSTSPVGGDKYAIYHSSIGAGVLLKKHIRLKANLAFRHYRSYYDYIQNNNLSVYNDNPTLSASNVLFFVGSEFLIGHFSAELTGGINLYKPFYKTHWEVFERTSDFDKKMKSLFAVRLGANAYLFNTKNLPKHNFRIGAFINTNFGQADFPDVAVGYVYRLR